MEITFPAAGKARVEVQFSIPGAPRTKKTSPQIVQAMGRAVLVPSEAHKRWFRVAMMSAPIIRTKLIDQGVPLPLRNQVSISALFFRQTNTGDAVGYYQALGDYIQAPRHKNGKTTRRGAGLINDDRQIRDWDGSRLLKDADNPRIEVTMTIIGEPIGPQGEMEFEAVGA